LNFYKKKKMDEPGLVNVLDGDDFIQNISRAAYAQASEQRNAVTSQVVAIRGRNDTSGMSTPGKEEDNIDVDSLVRETLAAHIKFYGPEAQGHAEAGWAGQEVGSPAPTGSTDCRFKRGHKLNDDGDEHNLRGGLEDAEQHLTPACSTQKHFTSTPICFGNESISPIKPGRGGRVGSSMRIDDTTNREDGGVMTSTQKETPAALGCELSPIKSKKGKYRRSERDEYKKGEHTPLLKQETTKEQEGANRSEPEKFPSMEGGRTFIHLDSGEIMEDTSARESTIPERYPAMNPRVEDWSTIHTGGTPRFELHKGRYNKPRNKKGKSAQNRNRSYQDSLEIKIVTEELPHRIIVECVGGGSISGSREDTRYEQATSEEKNRGGRTGNRSKKTGSRRRNLATVTNGKIAIDYTVGPTSNGRAPTYSDMEVVKPSNREVIFASDIKSTLPLSTNVASQDVVFENEDFRFNLEKLHP
jgi:hypothetical protein